jgi:hypothetical protein
MRAAMTLTLLDMIDAARRTGQDDIGDCIGQLAVTESRRFEVERILVSLQQAPVMGERSTPRNP